MIFWGFLATLDMFKGPLLFALRILQPVGDGKLMLAIDDRLFGSTVLQLIIFSFIDKNYLIDFINIVNS